MSWGCIDSIIYLIIQVSKMNKEEIIELIKKTESPLKRQLLLVALISYLLRIKGKEIPVIIGGLALSYYTREVYFTADIDLAYSDEESLGEVLKELNFKKKGKYWVSEGFKAALEVSVDGLAYEEAPLEIVGLGPDLQCKIIGVEDLIIERLKVCKQLNSETDCEMSELLIMRYFDEVDWEYLELKAAHPEIDVGEKIRELKSKVEA